MHARPIDASAVTVNDTIRLYPETVAVFNEFGIDSCCGGAETIRAAALRDGADPDALEARLNQAVEATP